MVQTTLMHPKLLHIEKGRYEMLALLTKDVKLSKTLIEMGREHLASLKFAVHKRR